MFFSLGHVPFLSSSECWAQCDWSHASWLVPAWSDLLWFSCCLGQWGGCRCIHLGGWSLGCWKSRRWELDEDAPIFSRGCTLIEALHWKTLCFSSWKLKYALIKVNYVQGRFSINIHINSCSWAKYFEKFICMMMEIFIWYTDLIGCTFNF